MRETGYSVKYTSINELGLHRKTNQDRVLVQETKHGFLALVCDGIGGGRAGDVASQMVVDIFEEMFEQQGHFEDDEAVISWFRKTLNKANRHVFSKGEAVIEYDGMGTTLIGVVIRNKRAIGFNVGDSRLYEFRHAKLNLLSHDQTYAYQMYLQNEISKEEIERHPHKNALINAVGINETITFETIRVIDGWTRIMLSSDGLHGFVPHAYLEQAFNLNIEKSTEVLKDLAFKAGGYDNISFIIVEEGQNG